MTAAEITDRLWAKYVADLPAEKYGHAWTTLADMRLGLAMWPELWVSVIRDAIKSLRAWRETKDVQG